MLDEPLGSLDRTLRERLMVDLREILRASRQTAIYVTHDQEEAFSVADRIVLMNWGRSCRSAPRAKSTASLKPPLQPDFSGWKT